MRIVSMAVAALIAMTVGAFADQIAKSQKGAAPDLPSKSLEFVKADGWMVITQNEADSPCLGDLSVPKCSAETLIACFLRNSDEWCSAAMGESYTFHSHSRLSDDHKLYRFLLIEPMRNARYFQEPENGGSGGAHGVHTQAGDVHIVVLLRDCQGEFQRNGNNICNKRVYKMHYFASQQASGNWIIMGGFTDHSVKHSDL